MDKKVENEWSLLLYYYLRQSISRILKELGKKIKNKKTTRIRWKQLIYDDERQPIQNKNN